MGRGKRHPKGWTQPTLKDFAAQGAGYPQAPPSAAPAAPTSQAAAAKPSRPKRLGKAVYERPPWPESDWAKAPDFVTEHRIRDAEDLAATLAGLGVGSWAELSTGPVTTVVSGTSFDNAHGTHPIRLFDREGKEEWFQQELSLYLLAERRPVAELNLADLCAWASAPERGQGLKQAGTLLLDQGDLAAFADEHGLSWHEPDEQEVTGRAQGKRLDRSPDGLRLDLCQMQWNERRGDYDSGQLLASVYLVDLLAWTAGWTTPEPRQETRRGRVSPLGA